MSGEQWKLLAIRDGETISFENVGCFDQMLVDDWFHLERMDDDLWWMRVGDARIMVRVARNGVASSVEVERSAYP